MMNITNIVLSAYLAFGQPVPNSREVIRYGGVQTIHADGGLSLRITETGRRELPSANGRHVVVESRDESYPFFLTRHVVFHDDCDVAETWVEIRHEEEGPVRLVKMDSYAAEIPGATNEVRVLTLAGAVQHEGRVVESALAFGQTLATSSREGIRNAWESNPAMMVSFGPSTETSGEVLGVALEWTGCSAKSVRREFNGATKVFIGVDNPGGPYVLDPGVTLKTPRAMLVLSRHGKGEVSRQFHRWAHRHLMPHGYDLHPVLLNSWEGSYFSFTEKTLIDMMDGVREMGGEMFVLDDGWFGRGRYARDEVNKDTSGLGDWVVNDRKLPHGLGWLSDQAKARGLKFGLWVEPEMVNTNSALCVAHPDWMLQEPKRRTLLGRGGSQNTLDLCNPAVRNRLFELIDAVYSTIPDLAYVKWDANGPISNLGSPHLPRDRQGNLWFDYTTGLYDLLARFQAKRPHVMTQACASGGGHMDFGFLRYADEFWTSDRTDPVDRVLIQWGASQFYPATAMACHVTASPNHQSKRATPLKYRFDVAMSGRLGIELHPTDLTAEELAYAKEQIARYKRIRPTVQQGELYRLVSPYENRFAALMYVNESKSSAVVFAYGLDKPLDASGRLPLQGLDPNAVYRVDGGETMPGSALMTTGLPYALCGAYASQVVELTKVASGEVVLPEGSAPAALSSGHFPGRVHEFVWRNWNVVEPTKVAKVLGTSEDNVTAMAASMGLPPAAPIPPEMKTRGYLAVLRRNWHLLPYSQLLELLEMTPETLDFKLREEDFLFYKLGSLKPKCEPLRYKAPDEAARRRADEIRNTVERDFGDLLRLPVEPRFDFVRQLGSPVSGYRPPAATDGSVELRFVYSYLAVFGDPLKDPDIDPYPDGFLQRLSSVGVNGIWLHVVLRDLAPGGEAFPEFGEGHAQRLANLRRLVARAKRYGVSVFLYMNEPRSMPHSFFEKRPGLAGVKAKETTALCTTCPDVRKWMSDALAHIFREVPDLGGIYAITASENLTSCASLGGWKNCKRCKDRTDTDIIAEVVATLEEGVHRSSPKAKVIVSDWGWKGHGDAREIIARLPKDVTLMSVSEWDLPIERGGVKSKVGEYSISAVGPGPRAPRHWDAAAKAGVRCAAEIQFNNTCELPTIPHLPVMDLVAEHLHNLAPRKLSAMLIGWTMGGHPSPNFELARRMNCANPPDVGHVLDQLAHERFGAEGAPHARKAWTLLSGAYREYPYHISVIYTCPVTWGAANPLYPATTGYKATMWGLPYDDLDGWRGPYPREVYAAQFEKVAAGWRNGVEELRKAVEKAPAERRDEVRADQRYAQAAGVTFQSVANQARFVMARDALAKASDAPAEERRRLKKEIRQILESEIALAREQYALVCADSRIGFEPSCQYFYLPLDLLEKVVNCRWLQVRYAD